MIIGVVNDPVTFGTPDDDIPTSVIYNPINSYLFKQKPLILRVSHTFCRFLSLVPFSHLFLCSFSLFPSLPFDWQRFIQIFGTVYPQVGPSDLFVYSIVPGIFNPFPRRC